MNPNYELRSFADEVRMVEEDGKKYIRGYAAVFNSPSQVMTTPAGREFIEIIKPGAFARSLADADVAGLFNHKSEMLLGRRSAGTLQLGEDGKGLWYKIEPPTTGPGPYVRELLERGDMKGSSFAFATVDDDWSPGAEGRAVRELREVHLFDVGPVVFPAYLEASAAYRSLDEHLRATEVPPRTFPTPEQRRVLQRLQLVQLF